MSTATTRTLYKLPLLLIHGQITARLFAVSNAALYFNSICPCQLTMCKSCEQDCCNARASTSRVKDQGAGHSLPTSCIKEGQVYCMRCKRPLCLMCTGAGSGSCIVPKSVQKLGDAVIEASKVLLNVETQLERSNSDWTGLAKPSAGIISGKAAHPSHAGKAGWRG